MVFRRALSVVFVAVIAIIPGLSLSSSAHADVGFIYYCSSITDGDYQIAFSKIYQCSNGPFDNTFLNKYSLHDGTRVSWISGECAFYAHHDLGWTDMTKVWNHCLTHKDWPTCNGSICQSKRLVVSGRHEG
jgi:hypothetical protein